MAGQQQQHYYKIVLLGDVGVGKTSIFNRLKTGRFIQPSTTVGQGTDQFVYTTTIGEDSLIVTLWDTAGGERFRTLTNNFYREAHGAMLVYSVEDSYTFENLKDWIEDASPHISPDAIEWALIGNKCDIANEVGKERVEARLKQLGAKISYVVSAKNGHNVMQAFDTLIKAIHKKSKDDYPDGRPRRETIAIDSGAPISNKEKKSGSCCN